MTLVKRSKETNTLLEGAVYTVSAVKWNGTAWEPESSTNNWSRDVTTDATGKGVLSLLTVDSRIYQIKEKTAPAGYQLDPTAYYVMFTNDATVKALNEARGVTVYAAPTAGITVNHEITVSDARIPTQPVGPGAGGTDSGDHSNTPSSKSPEVEVWSVPQQTSLQTQKLPKTGGFVGSAVLFLLGGGLVGCGV